MKKQILLNQKSNSGNKNTTTKKCWRPGAISIFLLFLCLSFSINSCRDDVVNENPPEKPLPGKATGAKMEAVTYDQFLKQIKGYDKELLTSLRAAASTSQRTSGDDFKSRFELKVSTSDSVRRIVMNNHVTYTLAVKPLSRSSTLFQNLIIDSTETGVNSYVLTYFPTKSWVRDYRKNKKTSFRGRVIMTDHYLKKDSLRGGRVNQQICASVMVLIEIIEHLCCHNQQGHGACGCAPGQGYYLEYSYDQVTTCTSIEIPTFSGGWVGGGTGGGGGGTAPNPGNGYEPCTGPQDRTMVAPPCETNEPPGPQPIENDPYYTPNSNVSSLITLAATKGVTFTAAQVPALNALSPEMITRIKNLITKFGAAVQVDWDNLVNTINGEYLTDDELAILNTLAAGTGANIFIIRLVYAANAYAAQLSTAAKFNAYGSTCENCKANAFKHALFLIFNAEPFTLEIASILAAAHESESSGQNTEMDKKNNMAGMLIYEQFSRIGTPLQWVDRVKTATSQGQYGMVFIKNGNQVSTSVVDPTCP
jgi:hypothetical protein